jgi:hypothetical protein
MDENGVPAPATRGLSGRLRATANRVLSEKVPVNGGNGHGPDGEHGEEAERTAIAAGHEEDAIAPPDES